MNKSMLFTDGSVNTKTKVGYGAYLVVHDFKMLLELLKLKIKIKRFENTSSAKLELQILLHALGEIKSSDDKVIVYTDSQNLISLPERREVFEKNDYRSKKGKLLNNSGLYKEFYKLTDRINCEFIKVIGHKKSNQKDDIENIFTLVDRASRKALRNNL